MRHPGDGAGARQFVRVSEMSKPHLRAKVMESGPTPGVAASIRPSGSSDRQTLVAFPAPLVLPSPAPAPACFKPSAQLMTGIYPGASVPTLQLPSLMPSAGSCLSQEAHAEGQTDLLDAGDGFIPLVQLLA